MSSDDPRTPPSDPTRMEPEPPEPQGVGPMHEPIAREMAEPRDGYEPMPLWLIFFCLALMGWGGWYLGNYSGGWDAQVYDERPAARAPGEAAPAAAAVDPMVLGSRVYNNCRACHQADGSGVPATYPPLAGAERVLARPDTLARIVLHGLEGPVVVRGNPYNNAMPPWRHLTDEQLAAVLTYVRASFGNDAPPVDPELVAAIRRETEGRRRPFTDAELNEVEASLPAPAASAAAGSAGAGDGS
jgi:mono/diheme cytochrome c family protein